VGAALRRVLAAAALAATAVSAAGAECPLGRYRLEGTVADRATGRPVEGARVLVFLDDDASPWRDAPRRPPDYARSDADGRFASSAIFATGAPAEANAPGRCDRRPSELEVVVTREGALTLRQRLRVADLQRKGTKQEPVLRLPPLLLEVPPPEAR